jgi:hypothetical protein
MLRPHQNLEAFGFAKTSFVFYSTLEENLGIVDQKY